MYREMPRGIPPPPSPNANYRRVEYIDKRATAINKILNNIFNQISKSLVNDRSYVKLNMLEKGAIQGFLHTFFGERTKQGIRNYINGMYPEELKELCDTIRKDLDEAEEDEKRTKDIR